MELKKVESDDYISKESENEFLDIVINEKKKEEFKNHINYINASKNVGEAAKRIIETILMLVEQKILILPYSKDSEKNNEQFIMDALSNLNFETQTSLDSLALKIYVSRTTLVKR